MSRSLEQFPVPLDPRVEFFEAGRTRTIDWGAMDRLRRWIGARDYLMARDWRTVLSAGLGSIFDRCDAIVTGVSPEVGGAGPADANIVTAFLGLPSVTLPLLGMEDGRAIGLQLVGRRGEDARLLRTAAWLQSLVLGQGENRR